MRTGALLAIVALLVPLTAAAATVDVGVGPGLTFDPASVTIVAGDTVRWIFSGFHTTTSDTTTGPEVWDSGILSSGSFSHTFTTAGDYPYYCAVHSTPASLGGTAMNGVVHVVAPPTVAITAVTPSSALPGAAVTITGTGFQSGAAVTFRGVASPNVTFVNDTTLTAVVPNIAAGAAAVIVMNPDETSASFAGFAVAGAAVRLLSPAVLFLMVLALAAAAVVALR